MDMRQVKAIEAANKKKILAVCAGVPARSGIYFLLREEDGFRYAYIGQAKDLLTRLAQHLNGYQHIDLSIKKHGLYRADNPTGWRVHFLEFPESELDAMERKYIKMYANKGYQLRNKTIGGQGQGKSGMDDNKPAKTYHDGLKQGYLNAQRYVANLFAKHLNYQQKSERPNKNQEKAAAKFRAFLEVNNETTCIDNESGGSAADCSDPG